MSIIFPLEPGDPNGPRLKPSLPEFLLARIAEDERLLEREDRVYGGDGEVWTTTAHARVRAQCEAYRRIVARHTGCDDTSFGEPCDDLRDLASIYADHPDHQEEWKP